ncbi:outer membrane protein TolC [Arcticibacter pallidicorallinus]|uniref:Outer membrane protein TolC n=1 Tax=Arcticibacter pallidicorallinus TaxID=1259464 RepID=A0A2T0TXE5_9SPHI|nr:TolC family protein [Arcticibacter pallidicorallinus]PRY50347.1 outer membrane protein TolC [Arcticibacter pallidicorallinus]
MKEKIFTLAALFLSAFIYAQTSPTILRISLEEARKIAAENNPDLKIKDLDIRIADTQVAQTRSRRIPQIYGDFNTQRNLIIPVTPVPANAFRPDAVPGELIPLRFTTKWTSNTGLNADVDIFNPQKRADYAESRLQAEIRKTEKELEENDLRYSLDQAYAATVIATEQLKLAAYDTLATHDVWKMSIEQFEAGRLFQADLNQVKADRNNAFNRFEEAQKILQQTRAELMLLMGYEPSDVISIELTDSIESLYSFYQGNATSEAQSITLKKLRQEENLLQSQIRNTKEGFLPTISLRGYYGASYFDNNLEIFKGDNWYGNSFISLGVRLPITESIERSKKLTEIRLQTEANRLAYQSQQNKNQLDRLEAEREILFLGNKYRRSKENYDLASDTYRIVQEQYNNGRLLIGDLARSSYAYQLEKNNYLNVAYDYIIAKMKLEKTLKN